MILMTFGVGISIILTGFLATKLLAPQEGGQECKQDLGVIVRRGNGAAMVRECSHARLVSRAG
jgi:hypothetical protein